MQVEQIPGPAFRVMHLEQMLLPVCLLSTSEYHISLYYQYDCGIYPLGDQQIHDVHHRYTRRLSLE